MRTFLHAAWWFVHGLCATIILVYVIHKALRILIAYPSY